MAKNQGGFRLENEISYDSPDSPDTAAPGFDFGKDGKIVNCQIG